MELFFNFVLVSFLTIVPTVEAVKYATFAGREKINFDFGWRHKLGKDSSRWVTGSTTAVPGPAQEKFNDSLWELVDAPHDMLIVQKFEQNASQKQAFIY